MNEKEGLLEYIEFNSRSMLMNIYVEKHINESENNKVEYLFIHFDYFDGNDLVAKLFEQEFQMISEEKIDGFWYTIIKLHKDSDEYHLVWHEDVGNYMYSVKQDENSILVLEQRLKIIIEKLNEMIKS